MAKSTVASNAEAIEALTGLMGNMAEAITSISSKVDVLSENVTKAASGSRTRGGNFVAKIGDDHKGNTVGVIQYADSGDVYVTVGYHTKGGKAQTARIPVRGWRIAAANLDKVEAMLSELE